jgi:hypothetical protein
MSADGVNVDVVGIDFKVDPSSVSEARRYAGEGDLPVEHECLD